MARGVATLVDAENNTGLSLANTESDVFLAALARDVVRTRIDFVHFPIIYYFASSDKRASSAHCLSHLVRFAREGAAPAHPKRVRLAAAALDVALNDLCVILAERFVDEDARDRAAIFEAYAADPARDDG